MKIKLPFTFIIFFAYLAINLSGIESVQLKTFLYPLNNYRDDSRKINDLKVFKDRLYIGFGDYGINTGDTDIVYYDFKTGKITSAFTTQDEAVMKFCEIDSVLMVPGADATEDWNFGNMYIEQGDVWHKYRTIPKALHLFDITKYDNKLFISAGTALNFDEKNQIANGCIYTSADSAKTWNIAYSTPADNYSVYRIEEVLPFKGKLYGFVHCFYQEYKKDLPAKFQSIIPGDSLRLLNIMRSNPLGNSEILQYNGRYWSCLDITSDSNIAFIKPVLFNNKLILEAFAGECVYGLNGRFAEIKQMHYLFDGEKATKIDLPFYKIIDYVVKKDKLYLLADSKEGNVLSIINEDLSYKNYVLPSKIVPLSVEVNDMTIYIGASDGNIYTVDFTNPGNNLFTYPSAYEWGSELPATDFHNQIAVLQRDNLTNEIHYKIINEGNRVILTTQNILKLQFFLKGLNNESEKILVLEINNKKTNVILKPDTKSLVIDISKENPIVKQITQDLKDYKYQAVIIGSVNQDLKANSPELQDLYRNVLIKSSGIPNCLYFKENFQGGLKKGKVSLDDIHAINYRNKIVKMTLPAKDIKFILEGKHRFSGEINHNLKNLDEMLVNNQEISLVMSDYLAEKIQQLMNQKYPLENTNKLMSNVMIEYLSQGGKITQ